MINARNLAHEAIGCECKLYSGVHDEICDRMVAAILSARAAERERVAKTVHKLADNFRFYEPYTRGQLVEHMVAAIRALPEDAP